jgi:hypothetical protein
LPCLTRQYELLLQDYGKLRWKVAIEYMKVESMRLDVFGTARIEL